MTALKKYARLEASALWRATPEDQRREVIVSIGNATLMISDMRDQAITHWSLAAVQRANPGKRPAVFHPDGDPGETLELSKDEVQMIDAIEKLRRAVERRRPHPGRLRWLGMSASIAAVAILALFWLPGALSNHLVSVLPAVKRAEIGQSLLSRIERMSGAACKATQGQRALQTLRARLGTGPLHILPGAVGTSLALPGGIILLDRTLVEDYEAADVIAGHILAEKTLSDTVDPLRDLLQELGTMASFQLLTTGQLKSDMLDRYAELLLTRPRAQPDHNTLLAAFEARNVSTTPYAYSLDVTGESVLALIEADPMTGQEPAVLLSDPDWLRLQNICGG